MNKSRMMILAFLIFYLSIDKLSIFNKGTLIVISGFQHKYSKKLVLMLQNFKYFLNLLNETYGKQILKKLEISGLIPFDSNALFGFRENFR